MKIPDNEGDIPPWCPPPGNFFLKIKPPENENRKVPLAIGGAFSLMPPRKLKEIITHGRKKIVFKF